MRNDIVFDTICPWCYIGKKRLEASLASAPMDDLEIHWNAFLLNPEMPPEGMDEQEYTHAKFGGEARARRVYAAIRQTGEASGIDFRLERINWVPNTIDSHRVIRYAERDGLAGAAVAALPSRAHPGRHVDDRADREGRCLDARALRRGRRRRWRGARDAWRWCSGGDHRGVRWSGEV